MPSWRQAFGNEQMCWKRPIITCVRQIGPMSRLSKIFDVVKPACALSPMSFLPVLRASTNLASTVSPIVDMQNG